MRDISCRTTNIFIQYVKNTRPEFLNPLLDSLQYDESYLSNPDNWIPWDIERILEERLARLFNDDAVMFKIGRSGMSLKSMGIINILFSLFTTPEHLIRATPKLARYFTKDIVHISIIETTKESATAEIKIKGRQTRGACLYTQGIFSAIPEFFGLEPAVLTETQCVVPPDEVGLAKNNYSDTVFGAESCVYRVRWKNRMGGFINRFTRKKMTMREAFRHLEESHAKLQMAYEQMIEAERFAAKGMIAAEIAHEINNSLANIETGLFIMNNIHTDRRYRQDVLKDIYEEIERMSGIVKGILEVYRPDVPDIQNVDINTEISKVADITQRRLKGKGISVVSRLFPDLPSIPCYPGHIKQILLNLIKNAEEAMSSSERKQISVTTEDEGDFVKLKVSDTGCGVPEEMKNQVFDPLVTSKAGSTGLGLSICREIAGKYGGDIKIESSIGQGTTVILSLRKNRYA